MKNKTLSLSLMALMLVFSVAIQAQITGTVLEEATGEPVIGASILQVGTTNGVITDFDGNFEINVPDGAQLQFSYMGFASQTLAAKDGMVVRMAEDSHQLQEVVAIGYGSQKKKEVTGSVASVKAEDFNAGAKASPVGLLQGKVAGLNISRTTADPTSTGYNIQIRGFSTLGQGTGNSPLYIVDGIPTSNIDNISPDEIASMDVLKDGSAAAIYGTRGTNGVILITTKRGSNFNDKAETQVEYSGYVNVSWVNSKTGMATADEFRQLSTWTGGKMAGVDLGASTDWAKEITRTAAVTHNHNLAISGAHKNFTYRASVNYKGAEGIAKNNGRQEIIAKLAADQKALNGWLQLQYDASYMHYRNDLTESYYKMAAELNPTMPIYDSNSENGFYTAGLSNGQYNPVEALKNKEHYQDGNFFRGSFKATVNIKAVEGLKVNAFAAIEEGDNHSYEYTGQLLSTGSASWSGWANRSKDKEIRQLYEATVDYANSWNGHNFVAVAGFSYQHYMKDGMSAANRGFAMDNLKYYSIGEGTADKSDLTVSSYRNSNKLAAAFARVNYNYNEKYLLSASLRAEGSSRFGQNNKWGWFPAASAGWRIKGEDFMRDADWCNDMKLRFGFGVTGNNLGSDLMSVALLSKSDVIEFNGGQVNTYTVSQNINPNLRWEKKYEYNLGLDFSFFQNRMSGSLEGYFRHTKDLLWWYNVPTPPYQYPTLLANAGQMVSYGVELALTGIPVQTKEVTWTSTLTLAWNRNRITKLSDEAQGFNYTESFEGYLYGNKFNGGEAYTQLLKEGGTIGEWYGYKFLGIVNGKWYYEDRYGDPTANPQTSDKKYLGSAQPALTYGWNNTVKYKNLDVTIFLRGVLGNKILNVTRYQYTPDGTDASTNYNFFVKDVKNGYDGNPVYADYQNFSDYWLESGSYLKCDNITVGYTWNFKDNNYIRSLRIYGTGTNLFTITSYSGLDPEVNTSSLDYSGVDIDNFYPKTASFLFGVNLNLL